MCLQRLVVHANYTATFVSIYMVAVDAVVASGWGQVEFWKLVRGGRRIHPPTRPPTQGKASDIFLRENNASGVGGKVGPDAAGEKSLQRGDFSVAVNLT